MVHLEKKMVVSKRVKRIILYGVWLAGCLIVTALFIGPFVWMVISSLKPPKEILAFPPTLLPRNLTLKNFSYAWQVANWPRMFLNSAFVTGTSVILMLFFNSLAGFAFAKIRFPARKILFFAVIGALLVPIQIPLIPRFIMMAKLGLVGTFTPLILFASCQAFHTFLFHQFFMGIPDELMDAAKIDGASLFYCYWAIALPLSKPVFATLAIFSFVWIWNAYIYPLIYVSQNINLHTVQIGLSIFQGSAGIKYGPLMAAATAVALPTIVVYLMFQKYFARGIVMTGLKT